MIEFLFTGGHHLPSFRQVHGVSGGAQTTQAKRVQRYRGVPVQAEGAAAVRLQLARSDRVRRDSGGGHREGGHTDLRAQQGVHKRRHRDQHREQPQAG